MNRFLIDTNVLLYYIRGRERFEKIESRLRLLSGDKLILISTVSLGEIHGFMQRQEWGEPRKERLQKILDHLYIIDISMQDIKLLEAYATVWNYSKNALPGKPLGRSIGIGQNDVWIAATAIVTHATLVSSDKDFDHLDKTFLNLIKV
jgi:predicted nucleic acid-binding protein